MGQAADDILSKISPDLSLAERGDLRKQLVESVNHLLLTDFNKLVSLLYRVDVDEQKLKNLLRENPGTDAAVLIADLLLQRQEEKIRFRRDTKPPPGTGADRW